MHRRLWKQVTLPVPLPLQEAVADFAATLTGRGVGVRKEGPLALIDAWLDPDCGGEELAAIDRYFDDLARHGDLPDGCRPVVRAVPEEDWMAVFRSQHVPLRVSGRLVVRPAWCEPAGPGDLVLDPGMAFGTGSHATTRMCLGLLDGLPASTLRGRLLDLGTGTGILAIAGAFLGFREVLAVDIDPVAARVAAWNVRNNGAGRVVRVVEGGLEKADGLYDAVTANLSGRVLLDLASGITGHLAGGGFLIASGMVTSERQSVLAAFVRRGLDAVQVLEEGEWVTGLLQLKV